MIFEDNPIFTHDDDKFNRTPYVSRLANIINEWDGNNSLVIGLNGKWGSGKTSIINLLKEHLENQKTKEKPTIFFFNPWIFSDIEKLSFHFFNEISKGLENKAEAGNDRKISKNLRIYAEIIELINPDINHINWLRWILFFIGSFGLIDSINITSINTKIIQLVFSVVSLFLSVSKKAITFIQNLKSISKENNENKTTFDIKKEIGDDLKKRKNKLLIIIDDVDRLSADAIKHIFHLVRVNADFPNTVFLLAFDFDAVKKIMNDENIDGSNFISKTIQLPFDIPVVSRNQIEKYLLGNLQVIIDSEVTRTYENQFDQDYWSLIVNSGFLNLFSGMRDIKRYLSSLSFHLALVQEGQSLEVNLTDFLVVEAFRLFYPEYFTFISISKELFTKYDYPSYKEDEKKQNNELFNKNIEKIAQGKRKIILKITEALFPQINNLLGTSPYYIEYQKGWDKNSHICSKKHFDTYFSFMPSGISQYELDSFLSRSDSDLDVKKELFEYKNKGNLYELLEKIRLYSNDPVVMADKNINSLIRALFDISDDLPNEDGNHWINIHFLISAIISDLLSTEIGPLDIIRTIIEQSEGITGPVHFVNFQTPKQNQDNHQIFLFDEQQIKTVT